MSSTDWPNRSHVGNLERIDRRVSDLDKAWVNTGPRSGQGMGHELVSNALSPIPRSRVMSGGEISIPSLSCIG